MRCYFHLVNGPEAILDDTGIEVSNLEAAKTQAMKAVQDLHLDNGGIGEGLSGWSLNIVSADGSLLHSIDLATCDLSSWLH